MYPKLFEIGPVPVYSYGLMLGIAFLIGSTIFSKELRRKNLDENINDSLVKGTIKWHELVSGFQEKFDNNFNLRKNILYFNENDLYANSTIENLEN